MGSSNMKIVPAKSGDHDYWSSLLPISETCLQKILQWLCSERLPTGMIIINKRLKIGKYCKVMNLAMLMAVEHPLCGIMHYFLQNMHCNTWFVGHGYIWLEPDLTIHIDILKGWNKETSILHVYNAQHNYFPKKVIRSIDPFF